MEQIDRNRSKGQLPGRRPPNDREPGPGKPRQVTAVDLFWLDMDVEFTSTSGEQKQGGTNVENFPNLIRGAWSDLSAARVRFRDSSSGLPLSTVPAPLLTLAGNSDKVHPMLYWRRPLYLPAQSSLLGDFTNDGAEPAGQVVFLCERPGAEIEVPVFETRQYVAVIDLALSGGATGTGVKFTTQIDFDLLIYGAYSTSAGALIRLQDTQRRNNWSATQLPVGAFCGVNDGSNVQPIMYYPRPYLLRRNSTLMAEWTNAGNETGKYLAFVCERILR